MEGTNISNCNGGGFTNLKQLLLILCLAGLQSATVLATDEEKGMSPHGENGSEDDPIAVIISGPDYATVGIPCTVWCEAPYCTPANCTYSMALWNQTVPGQGNELSFTIPEWTEGFPVACTVRDNATGRTGSTSKTLQVLAGPTNISILRSDSMDNSFSCHAYCRPSCDYTWKIDHNGWMPDIGQGITIVPHGKTLTCKASNSVSGLFISETITRQITSGPSEVRIEGPDDIHMRTKTTFLCAAQCVPSCDYIWFTKYRTVRGRELEMTVNDRVESVTIECEAQNSVSRKSHVLRKTLRVSGHSRATRTEQASTLLLCALLLFTAISL